MADVAERLELSHAISYRYVESKEALLELTVRYAMDQETDLTAAVPLATYLGSRTAAGAPRPQADPEIAAHFLTESVGWLAQHRKRDPDAALIDDRRARDSVRELLQAAFVPDPPATGAGAAR